MLSGEKSKYKLLLSMPVISIVFSSLALENKVITTMVIRPPDDSTGCAQSVVADLAAISKGGSLTPRFGVRGGVGFRDGPIR